MVLINLTATLNKQTLRKYTIIEEKNTVFSGILEVKYCINKHQTENILPQILSNPQVFVAL